MATTQQYQTLSTSTLLVYVRTPEQIIYQGEAAAISAVNKKGLFDVLMQHENFITIIKEKVIIHMKNGEKKEFPIRSGVLKAEGNKIYIFLGLQDLINTDVKK